MTRREKEKSSAKRTEGRWGWSEKGLRFQRQTGQPVSIPTLSSSRAELVYRAISLSGFVISLAATLRQRSRRVGSWRQQLWL